jgi:hypothetical protein
MRKLSSQPFGRYLRTLKIEQRLGDENTLAIH